MSMIGQGGIDMLWLIEPYAQRLELIVGDNAYGGEFKDMAKKVYDWEVDTAKKPPSGQGFVPQKGRWQVERSFGASTFLGDWQRNMRKRPFPPRHLFNWLS